ncbi:MAG: HAD-IA family hydrolase [Candidatus Micrarchaeia archaeon]
MPVRHIFLDIDNTLFPSSEFTVKARRKALRAMISKGLACTYARGAEELRRIIAERGPNDFRHFNILVKRINGREDLKTVAAGIMAYHNSKRHISPYPEVHKVLRSLKRKGYRLYIASEGVELKQWDKLLRLGIDRFFDGVHVARRKDAAFFRRILKSLRLQPSECVMVGDRPDKDIAPAMRAGMHAVRIRRGKYYNMPGKANYSIRSLSQLENAIKKIEQINARPQAAT